MLETKSRVNKAPLFAIFLVCGFSIFAVPLLLGPLELFYRIIICGVFAVLAMTLRRNKALAKYFPVIFAYFIGSLTILFQVLLYSNPSWLNWISASTMDLEVVFKVVSAFLVIIPIVLLTKVSGHDMASLYLTKGKLRLGLIIGTTTFLIFLATSIWTSTLLYGGKNLTFEKLVLWAPWILVYVFTNGIKEEIQFRGLYLKKYEALLGTDSANFLQAIIFVFPHFGETYTPVLAAFLFIVFLLGLAFGAVTQKTNSLIGAILFHAGTDIPVVLGMFSNF